MVSKTLICFKAHLDLGNLGADEMSKKIFILLGIIILSLTYFTLAQELTNDDFDILQEDIEFYIWLEGEEAMKETLQNEKHDTPENTSV